MIDGRFLNGIDGTAGAATLDIVNGRVTVRGEGVDRDVPLEAVTISERIGRTPRFVRFPDGAFVEVSDVDALERLLQTAQVSSGRVSQWETSGRLVVAGAIAFVAFAVVLYVFGLPLLARVVADRLPISAMQTLGDQVLVALDSQVFDPSEVPELRRSALAARFAALRLPGGTAIPMRIEFRKSQEMGANALALPSGTIVVTDDLLMLAKSDDEILAVLAHEAGHVQERHGLRSIIQSSAVSLLVTWVVGDVGTLIAVAPTTLLQSKYSRDLERSADAYATTTLSSNALSTGALADILERMEASRGTGGGMTGAFSYVSSHPATSERIATLRQRP